MTETAEGRGWRVPRRLRAARKGSAEALRARVMAVTYQGAIDMVLSYIESHPDTDTDRYADALADILLAAMTT